jgi:hypothetical protein
MSAAEWIGFAVLLVVFFLGGGVGFVFGFYRPRNEKIEALPGEDAMKPFERGRRLGFSVGVKAGESATFSLYWKHIELAREMGVRVPIEISGGKFDGLISQGLVGAPVVILEEHDGTRHFCEQTGRSSNGGKTWVYRFTKTEVLNSNKS